MDPLAEAHEQCMLIAPAKAAFIVATSFLPARELHHTYSGCSHQPSGMCGPQVGILIRFGLGMCAIHFTPGTTHVAQQLSS